MKMSKKQIILLVINVEIFLSSVVIAVLGVCFGAGQGQLGDNIKGIEYFKPFTIDSNVLMGIIAGIYLVFLLRNITKQKEIPYFVNLLYFIGATSLALTHFTVVFFLAPVNGAQYGFKTALTFYTEDMFFYHFLNPVLAMGCFICLDSKKIFGVKENIFAVIPMALYSVIYLINVVILKNWKDFYGFTFGGKMYLVPFVLVVMFSVTYLFGFILRKIKKSVTENK